MRKLIAAFGLTMMACGGGGGGGGAGDAQAVVTAGVAGSAAAISSSAGEATVHEVKMVLTDAGEYKYVPDELTIKAGDTVRWINVSGGPHNVQFKAGTVPEGAQAVLNAAMADRMGEMFGPFLMAPNAVYEIDFTGAPTGEYPYVCTPHEMLGMVAALTIEE